MLLKNNFNSSKISMYESMFFNSNFFVLNINDFEQLNIFDNFFDLLTIFHYKNFVNFYNFDSIFDLFSGNNYFCFIEIYDFYNYLIKIINNIYKIDLLGICLNNNFFNLNNLFFNLSNKFCHYIYNNMYNIINFFLLFFFEIKNIFFNLKLNLNKN